MEHLINLIIAFLLLPILFVLVVVCAVIMLVLQGRPIFFSSERVGQNKQMFVMYKLRTMFPSTPLVPTSDEAALRHVTKFGRLLRATSLDEAPQILNVINGSMSFVGPRPCLMSESVLVGLREKSHVFTIKPGITGLAQVRGRDTVSTRSKASYDTFYKKKKSLLFDLYIVMLTVKAVLKRSNISH